MQGAPQTGVDGRDPALKAGDELSRPALRPRDPADPADEREELIELFPNVENEHGQPELAHPVDEPEGIARGTR